MNLFRYKTVLFRMAAIGRYTKLVKRFLVYRSRCKEKGECVGLLPRPVD